MEKESTEKEKDDGEIPDGDSASETEFIQWQGGETDDSCKFEDKMDLKSQETPNPPPPQDASSEAVHCGSTEAKEDTDEVSDGFENDRSAGHEDSQVINQEEDEAAKEHHMNGESGWRNMGSGRRCKLRSGVSVLEQSSQSVFSSFQKASVMSSGARHKQTRRRNHHHHQQNRGRRRTGNQLVLAFKEMLSESLSFWCISCIHMLIEIIVTLTHNCGVGVETGVVKLYNFGQQFLIKITDVPGMKADISRITKWTKCRVGDLLDKTLRSMKWVKTAVLSCFGLFCTLAILSSQWAKGALVRIGGERSKYLWTAFQESRVWKRAVSLLGRVRSMFRRDGRTPPFPPESPGRTGRAEPGQELERLLALAEVPEEELDPFTVLGVEVHATETELKKAYRQLAVQVCAVDIRGSHAENSNMFYWITAVMTNKW